MKRKIIALMLAAVMMLSQVPFAFAAEGGNDPLAVSCELCADTCGDDCGCDCHAGGTGDPAGPGAGGTGDPAGSDPADPGAGGGCACDDACAADCDCDCHDGDEDEEEEEEELEDLEPLAMPVSPFADDDLKIGVVSREAVVGGAVKVDIIITENPGISRINALKVSLGNGLTVHFPKGRENFSQADSATWPFVPGNILPVMGRPDIEANDGDEPVIGSNYIEITFLEADLNNPVTNVTGTGVLMSVWVKVPDTANVEDVLNITLSGGEFGDIDEFGELVGEGYNPELTGGTITVVDGVEVTNAEELLGALSNSSVTTIIVKDNIDLSYNSDEGEGFSIYRPVTLDIDSYNVSITNIAGSSSAAVHIGSGGSLTVEGDGRLDIEGNGGLFAIGSGASFTAADATVNVTGRSINAVDTESGGKVTFKGTVSGGIEASEGGEVTVTGNVTSTIQYRNVRAYDGGKIEITGNIDITAGADSDGVTASGRGSSVTVTGDVITRSGVSAVYASDYGEVTITGSVTGFNSGVNARNNAEVTVDGDVTSLGTSDTYSFGARASRNSKIYIGGGVTARYEGAVAEGWDGSKNEIEIRGSVTAQGTGSGNYGVYTWGRGNIVTVGGSVSAAGGAGVCAQDYSEIIVTGDVTSASNNAAEAGYGGEIRINGSVSAPGGTAKAAAHAEGNNAVIIIGGNAAGRTNNSGVGARALYGGRIYVSGNITGQFPVRVSNQSGGEASVTQAQAKTVMLRGEFAGYYWEEYTIDSYSFVYRQTNTPVGDGGTYKVSSAEGLGNALAAIAADGSDGIFTIELEADITYTGQIAIDNKDVTLDLGDYDLTIDYTNQYDPWGGAIDLRGGALLTVTSENTEGKGVLDATGGSGINADGRGTELAIEGTAKVNLHGRGGCAVFASSGAAVKVTSASVSTAPPGNNGGGVWAIGSGTVITVDGDVSGGWIGAQAEWGSRVTVNGNVNASGNAASARGWGSVLIITGNATSAEEHGAWASEEAEIHIFGNASGGGFGAEAGRGGRIYVTGSITGTGSNDVVVGDWAYWDPWGSTEDVCFFGASNPSRSGVVPGAMHGYDYNNYYWDEFNNEQMWEGPGWVASYVYKRQNAVPANTYAGVDSGEKFLAAIEAFGNATGPVDYTIDISGGFSFETYDPVELSGSGKTLTIKLNGYNVYMVSQPWSAAFDLSGGVKLTVDDTAGLGSLNIDSQHRGIDASGTGTEFNLAGRAIVIVHSNQEAARATDGAGITVTVALARYGAGIRASDKSVINVKDVLSSYRSSEGIIADDSTVTVDGDVGVFLEGGNNAAAVIARLGSNVTVRGSIVTDGWVGISANSAATVTVYGDVRAENQANDGFGIEAMTEAKVYVFGNIIDTRGGMMKIGTDGAEFFVGDEPPETVNDLSFPYHGYTWGKFFNESDMNCAVYVSLGALETGIIDNVTTAEELYEALTSGYKEVTINIAADITAEYSEEIVISGGRKVEINLGEHDVSIENTQNVIGAAALDVRGAGTAVTVDSDDDGTLTLIGSSGLGVHDGGKFITEAGAIVSAEGSDYNGVFASEGGSAAVTTAKSDDNYGACAAMGGVIEVTGTVTSGSDSNAAAFAAGTGSEITVGGEIKSEGYIAAHAARGGKINANVVTGVTGGAFAEEGGEIEVKSGGSVTISGDGYGVYATDSGSKITVTGNVTVETTGTGTGAHAEYGGEIAVTGNVTGKNRIVVSTGPDSTITVTGDVYSSGTGHGAMSWGQYSSIYITGNVEIDSGVGDNNNPVSGVAAAPLSAVVVEGDVVSEGTAIAVNSWGGTITIGGDAEAEDASYAIRSSGGGTVYVVGSITSGDDEDYDILIVRGGSIGPFEYTADNPQSEVELVHPLTGINGAWSKYSDDNVAGAGTRSYVYKYKQEIAVPEITTGEDDLPAGAVGVPYNEKINATGGAIRWSISETMPDGLSLYEATGLSFNTETGVISGTPRAPAEGRYTFTVTATNSKGSDEKNLWIDIEPEEPVYVTFKTLSAGDTVEKTYGEDTFKEEAEASTTDGWDGTITYSSSDESVATVSSDGTVTIAGAGTAEITAHATAYGNNTAGSASYTLTVNKKEIEIEVDDVSVQYGGAIPASFDYDVDGTQFVGTDGEDDLDFELTTTAARGSNAGKYDIEIVNDNSANYKVVKSTSRELTITPLPLTVTGAAVQNKTYDGTNTATVNSVVISGLLPGEALTAGTDYTVTGVFDNTDGKDAGIDKAVTVTVELAQTTKAGNYVFNGTAGEYKGAKASIFRKALTVTAAGITIDPKPYDGSINATVGAITFIGLEAGEVLSAPADYIATGTYANENVGTKNVTVTITLTENGPVSKNYTLATSTYTKSGCVIEKIAAPAAPVFVSAGVEAGSSNNVFTFTKVTGFDALGDYEFRRATSATAWTGWTTLSAANAVISGNNITIRLGNVAILAGGIEVRVKGTTTMEAGDELKGKPDSAIGVNLTGTVTISGTPTYGNTLTANVTGVPATVTAAERVYTWKVDGAEVAAASGQGDTYKTYVIRGVDIGKPITVEVTVEGGAIPGALVSNPTAAVAKKTITPVATAVDKTYDGTADAVVNIDFPAGALETDGQTVTITAGGTFADANAGNGKVVTVGGMNIAGAHAGYYNINQPVNPRANIAKRDLEVTPDNTLSKTYNVPADPDGVLTYTYEIVYTQAEKTANFKINENPAFTGALTRAAGNTVGLYPISKGSLNITNGTGLNGGSPNFAAANYNLTVNSGNFEVKPAGYTYPMAEEQNISKGATIGDIPEPAGGIGVGTEIVNGELTWYESANDRTNGDSLDPEDDTYFDEDEGEEVTLYWSFKAAATGAGANYVQTPEEGEVTFTIQEGDPQDLRWSNAAAAPAIIGGTVTRTYGDAKFTKTAAVTGGGGAVTYEISDTYVATVDPNTGEVTIAGAGEAIITATAEAVPGYMETSISYKLTVNKKALTIGTVTAATATNNSNWAQDKVYDGTADIVGAGGTGVIPTLNLTGFVSGDLPGDVTIAAVTAAWTSPNAGTKTINVTNVTLTGAKGGNYTVTPKNNVAVGGSGITPRPLDISDITVGGAARIYNGYAQTPAASDIVVKVDLGYSPATNVRTLALTTDYTVSAIQAGTNAGDYTMTITGRGNYSGVINNVTYTIDRADFTYVIDNQSLPRTSKLSDIAVPATGTGVNNQLVRGTLNWYSDSNRTTLLDDSYEFGTISPPAVTLYWTFVPETVNGVKNYADKNGSVEITVNASREQIIRFSQPGMSNGGDYNVTYGDNANRFTFQAYNATMGGTAVTGFTSSDMTVATVTEAANGTVTVNILKAGTAFISAPVSAAAGYNAPDLTSLGFATGTAGIKLEVAPRPLTIAASGNTAATKVYDGTDDVTGVTLTLTGWYGTDFSAKKVAIGTVTAAWSSENAGTKTIDVTGVTLTGEAALNYTVTVQNNVPVSGNGITARNITGETVTITGASAARTYNGLLQLPDPDHVEIKVNVNGSETRLDFRGDKDFTFAIASTNSAVSAANRTSAGTNVGTVTVRVTGTGNFTGTATGTYVIEAADYSLGISSTMDVTQGTLPVNIPVSKTGTGISAAGVQEIVNGTLTWYTDSGYTNALPNTTTAATQSPFPASAIGQGAVTLYWRFVPAISGAATNYMNGPVTAASIPSAAIKEGSVAFTVTDGATQTLTWSNAAAAPAIVGGGAGGDGGTVTRIYGDASFTKTAARPANGGAITYTSSSPAIAAVNPSTGAVAVQNLSTGTVTITATAAAVPGLYQETSISYTLEINPKPLTIGTATTGTARIGGTYGTLNLNSAPSRMYDGTKEIYNGDVTLNLTGFVGTDVNNVTLGYIDAEWSGANAGIKTIDVNSVSLGGTKGNCYTVTPRKDVTVAGNGITARIITSPVPSSINVAGSYTYTGAAPVLSADDITASVSVRAGSSQVMTGVQMKAGTDFTWRVTGTAAGDDAATIEITGRGNFTGTASGTFNIGKADYTYSVQKEQVVGVGSTVAELTARVPEFGMGVGGERVNGTLTWHNTSAAAMTGTGALSPSAAPFGTVGNSSMFYWRFVPAAAGAGANYAGIKTGATDISVVDIGVPVVFTNNNAEITRTYGDTNNSFTNAVTAASKGTRDIEYSSSDSSIATVDNNGVVTIRRAGIVVITAAATTQGASDMASGSYTLIINRKPLDIDASGNTADHKEYDGSTNVTGVTLTLTGYALSGGAGTAANNDFTAGKVRVDTDSIRAEWTSKNAGTRTINVTSAGLEGELADSYIVRAKNGVTVNANTGTLHGIQKKDIVVTPTSGLSKPFSMPTKADPAGYLTYTFDGVVSPEVARFTGALTRANAGVHTAGEYLIQRGTLALTNGVAGTNTADFLAANYNLVLDPAPVYFTITKTDDQSVIEREVPVNVQWNDPSVKSLPMVTGLLANIPGYVATDVTSNKLTYEIGTITGTGAGLIRDGSVAFTGNKNSTAYALTFALKGGLTGTDANKTATIPVTVSGFTNLEDVTINVNVNVIDFMRSFYFRGAERDIYGNVIMEGVSPKVSDITELMLVRGSGAVIDLSGYLTMEPADMNGTDWRELYDITFTAVNNAAVQLTTGGMLTVKTAQTAAPMSVNITATMKAKANSPFAGETRTAVMTVKIIAGMQNVTLNNTAVNVNGDVTLAVGRTFTRAVTYTPANAAVLSAEWSSSDPAIASVNKDTGAVTAHKPGRVTITLKAVPQAYDLSVTSGVNAGMAKLAMDRMVETTPGSGTFDKSEPCFERSYTVFVPTAELEILVATADVDSTAKGKLMPDAAKNALVDAGSGNSIVTGKLLYAVPPGPAMAMTMYPEPDYPSTDSFNSYKPKYATEIQLDITDKASLGTLEEVVWTTSNANIARVDQNGKVTTGNTAGTATITASVRLKNEKTGVVTTTLSKSATVRVQVFVPSMTVDLAFSNVNTTPSNPAMIETGKTRTLTPKVNMDLARDGRTRLYANPTTAGVTWSIVKEAPKGSDLAAAQELPAGTMTGGIVSVNTGGVVTGRAPGQAIIRATTRPDLTGQSIYKDFTVTVETPVTALSLSHRNAFTLSTVRSGGTGDIPGNPWKESWNQTTVSAIINNGSGATIHDDITWTLSRYDILEFAELTDPNNTPSDPTDDVWVAVPAGTPYVGDNVTVRVRDDARITSNTTVTLTASREQMAAPFATAALRSTVNITVTNSAFISVSSARISNAVPHTVERAGTVTRINNAVTGETYEFGYDYYLNPLKTGSTFTPAVAFTPTSASNRNIVWEAVWGAAGGPDGETAGSTDNIDKYIRLNRNTGAVTGLVSTGGKLIQVKGVIADNPSVELTSTRPSVPAATQAYYEFAVVQRATRVTLKTERNNAPVSNILRHNDPNADELTISIGTIEPAAAMEDIAQIVWGPATTAAGIVSVVPQDLDNDGIYESVKVKALKPGTVSVTAGVITTDNVRVNATQSVIVHMPAERVVIRNPAGAAVTLPANHKNNPYVLANGTAVALTATVNGAVQASAQLGDGIEANGGVPAVTAKPALTAPTNRNVRWFIQEYTADFAAESGAIVEARTSAAVNSAGGVASITNAGRVTAIKSGWIKVIAIPAEITDLDPATAIAAATGEKKAEVYIKTEVRAATVRMQQTAFSMRPGETLTINAISTVTGGEPLLGNGAGQYMWYANDANAIRTGTGASAVLTGYVLSYDSGGSVFNPIPVTTNPLTVPGYTGNDSLTIRAGDLPAGVTSRAVTITVRTPSGRTASVTVTVNAAAQEVVNLSVNKSVTWIQQGRTETLTPVFNQGLNPATKRAWPAPANRNVYWEIDGAWNWNGSPVSPASSIATIDTAGKVTATGVGWVRVKVTSQDVGSGTAQVGYCTVYCMAKP